jgi:hypothetical protein
MNIGLGSLSFSSSFPAGAWALSAARVKKSTARLTKKRLVMASLEVNARVVAICACWGGLSGDSAQAVVRPVTARSFDPVKFGC